MESWGRKQEAREEEGKGERGVAVLRCCCLMKLPGFDGKMLDLLTCDDRMGTGRAREGKGEAVSEAAAVYKLSALSSCKLLPSIYSTTFCSHISYRHPSLSHLTTNNITHSVNTHTLIHSSRSIQQIYELRTNTSPVPTRILEHFPLTTPAFIHPDSSFQELNPLTLDRS